MEINNYLCEIFNKSIKAVVEKKIAINIEITPECASIKIEPWEPFHYNCPYEEKS